MNLTKKDLLSINRKSEHGISKLSPKLKIRDVSTDSRSIRKGDLFIALRGEKFDGHEFLSAVRKQGAIAAIVDEKWYKSAAKKKQVIKLPLLVVKNTLDCYGELANLYRKKFSIPVLLVAGSNGKTTMKEVISHVLGTSFNVLKTEANYNNHVGLPRMLLKLNAKHDVAVLEIGTNHPGEIAWLTRVAEPTHGIITNIGSEHLEFFKNIKGVAKEELALFDYLKENGGFAFINLNDKILAQQMKKIERWWAYGDATSFRAESLGFTSDGRLQIDLKFAGNKILFNSYLIADYAPLAFAAAAEVATFFYMSNEPSLWPNNSLLQLKKACASFKPFKGRMEILKLRGKIIINDTYNANPESFLSALQTLKKIPAKGKKYVIAGDMFELGNTSEREHRRLGKAMAAYKFNGYYLTGKAMKQAFAALITSNKKLHASYDTSKEDIVNALRTVLKKGDVILIKGSRGMKMETIIEQLRITN